LGPAFIRMLRRIQMFQVIREEGPKTHQAKQGTPTMGGLLILTAILVPSLLWCNLTNRYVQIALISTVWTGAIGFIDDYLRVVKRRPKGLVGRWKLFGQMALGLGLGTYLYFNPLAHGAGTLTSIPFAKGLFINFGPLFVLLVALVVTGTSNAVNLSDGIDGLAIGLSAFSFLAFAGLSYLSGHRGFSDYLNIMYLEGSGELAVFCMSVVGASLGFLWYNAHPAQVFMGDTGSLALGGTLGVVAVLLKRELLLVIIGGLFVAEAVSVFKMAPLHHHFELSGWHENQVVVRFWIVGALLVLLSLSTLKLQ
jgi:phospho-N-acetylmuramoyl-pentapeptide-transferase